MTAAQKQQVLALRARALSFTQIAETLSLSRNTVKSFCQREAQKQSLKPSNVCAHCGGPLGQRPKQRPRRFCCDQCRYAYWNAHPLEKRRRAPHTQRCVHCGKMFDCYASANRKYCGAACFNSARWGEAVHG